MKDSKDFYRRALKRGSELSSKTIENITDYLQQYLTFETLPDSLLFDKLYGDMITSSLTKLSLSIARGHPSWEGLVIGFPGTKEQLSTINISTPFIREILYPILELHYRIQKSSPKRMPCIYFIGVRFSDVLLRKFRFINLVTPHVIVITRDILSCASRKKKAPQISGKVFNESWVQKHICEKMSEETGLSIPTENKTMELGFLSYEVPTFEGTQNPERLDILAYDKNDHSLIAFEIKGPQCGRVQLENLYLQGMEHRNWLEVNKMAIKLLFEGPRGKNINTRKRVKLVLGFFGEQIPPLFIQLRDQALRKDRFLSINFCRFVSSSDHQRELKLERFDNYIHR